MGYRSNWSQAMGKKIANTKKQSGDDWGMGDDDDLFGTDIMNMDPHSEEFAAAVQADTDKGAPSIPGDTNAQGWSSDYTDSGVPGADLDGEDEPPEPGEPGHLEWYKKHRGQQAPEGASVKTGILRRVVRKLSPSLITAKA